MAEAFNFTERDLNTLLHLSKSLAFQLRQKKLPENETLRLAALTVWQWAREQRFEGKP